MVKGGSNYDIFVVLDTLACFALGAYKLNRIHHGWSVEIGKSQPEGPSVPVGNEARRVSHWNDPTGTMDPRVEIFLSPLNTIDGFFFLHTPIRSKFILPVK